MISKRFDEALSALNTKNLEMPVVGESWDSSYDKMAAILENSKAELDKWKFINGKTHDCKKIPKFIEKHQLNKVKN